MTNRLPGITPFVSRSARPYCGRNTDEAEGVFRECLRDNPRDARALFGLMETLKAEKKMDAAEWVRFEFESSWKNPALQLHLEDL